jgi:hypothetical protein
LASIKLPADPTPRERSKSRDMSGIGASET